MTYIAFILKKVVKINDKDIIMYVNRFIEQCLYIEYNAFIINAIIATLIPEKACLTISISIKSFKKQEIISTTINEGNTIPNVEKNAPQNL